MPSPSTVVVDATPVLGLDVDSETRCAHYGGARDVIAIRFACCGDYYPCCECHDTLVDHESEAWSPNAFDTPAVLCGACGTELTIRSYLDADASCPACNAGFNPGCRAHWPTYFDVGDEAGRASNSGPDE